MKKAIKDPFIALLSVILVMALTCALTETTGSIVYNSETAVSGITWDETILRDTARLKDLEILRANAKCRTGTEQHATAIGQEEGAREITGTIFKLPASLQYIDDEAFEGTALVNVEIPENVEYIGERAFSDIPTLRKVIIPEKTTTIAKSAFAGSSRVTITGAPGSYARKYARENGIPFAPLSVICANVEAGNGISLNQIRISDEVLDAEENDEQSDHQPAGRIAGKIKANITQNCAAYHITSRAPPVNA